MEGINTKITKYEDLPDICIAEEVAEYMHMSKGCVYALIHEGALKALRIGKTYRIPKVYIKEFMESLTSTYTQ